jgi:hypothetical protein
MVKLAAALRVLVQGQRGSLTQVASKSPVVERAYSMVPTALFVGKWETSAVVELESARGQIALLAAAAEELVAVLVADELPAVAGWGSDSVVRREDSEWKRTWAE